MVLDFESFYIGLYDINLLFVFIDNINICFVVKIHKFVNE